MHAGDPWITVGGDAWPEWHDTQRPDMPQQHDTATVQVPSDVHDTFLEGCGGDHRAAESLLRKTLLAPSVAEAVNAAHQHVASNPSDDHFGAAKERLSRVFYDFFERANQAEAMQMASLHMLALCTLRRKQSMASWVGRQYPKQGWGAVVLQRGHRAVRTGSEKRFKNDSANWRDVPRLERAWEAHVP
jgi:hypothetical protein